MVVARKGRAEEREEAEVGVNYTDQTQAPVVEAVAGGSSSGRAKEGVQEEINDEAEGDEEAGRITR
jgi:hypothetical protein